MSLRCAPHERVQDSRRLVLKRVARARRQGEANTEVIDRPPCRYREIREWARASDPWERAQNGLRGGPAQVPIRSPRNDPRRTALSDPHLQPSRGVRIEHGAGEWPRRKLHGTEAPG